MNIWAQLVVEVARMKEKHICHIHTKLCALGLENYVTSEGAVSHIVLLYQTLPITRYQEMFYANKYFE